MSRALAAVGLILFVLVLVLVRPAAADQPGGGSRDGVAVRAASGRVAVLPFAGEGRLAIYGQPVAAQVAKVGRAAGLEMVLLGAGAAVPGDVHLVIDGRLVKDGAAVVLEARVRDPERGLDVGRRSATAASLGAVDRAADDVATALVPVLRAGLRAQEEAVARAEATLARPRSATVGEPRAAGGGADEGADEGAVDRRPVALIALTGAVAGADGQAHGIAPLVAPSLVRLADRLGHRAAPLGERGLSSPAEAVASAGAGLAIVIAVLDVETAGRDILHGRARARVDVFDRDGLVFRRTVRTDTLIGSRGDRADTLVRAAVAQIVDVVAPRVRERLAAGAAGAAGVAGVAGTTGATGATGAGGATR